MIYVGILVAAGLLAAVEVPRLLRSRDYGTLAVVTGILVLGAGYAMALAAKLPIPSLAHMLLWLAGPLGRPQ